MKGRTAGLIFACLLMASMVMDYITKRGTVSPKVEGRIKTK